jgi:hypothetical protein
MIPHKSVADDAGALLVRSGLVTSSALDDARMRITTEGGTVGEALVAAGAVDDEALTDFYRQRLLVPRVNPNSLARLPMSVVTSIPADLAVELRAIPVGLAGDGTLTVAMSDPSDRHAVDEIASRTGAYVVRAVATQMQIAWCLANYYGHVTALGQRLLQEEPTARTAPAPQAPAPARKKSITEQVKASRTRRIERGDLMVNDLMAELEGAATVPYAKVPRIDSGPVNLDESVPFGKPPKIDSGPTKVEDSGPIMVIEAAEPSGPVITIEASSINSEPITVVVPTPPPAEDATDRKLAAPRRKKPAQPDPPELAARAGEVQLVTGVAIKAIDFDALPSIMISDELEHALRAPEPEPEPEPEPQAESVPEPVTPEATPVPIDPATEKSDVVVLEVRKQLSPRRTDRITKVGIVAAPARPRVIDDDTTRVDRRAAPARLDDTATDRIAAPPAPAGAAPPPSGAVSFDKVKRATTADEDDDDDAKSKPTMVMTASELDELIPDRTSDPVLASKRPAQVVDDSDEWGPPGSTIPPPLLGAVPGALEHDSAMIPLPNLDSAPLMVAPPSPPQAGLNAGIARALEEATARMLELIHTLDHATERDQIIALMIAHLAESHQRAGFFAARTGELSLFAITPRIPVISTAKLRLDRASTLADVVGTRLPYRGPITDDASRNFLTYTLGTCPPELLLVPIAVRDRIVGVLVGDTRIKHTFDDQLALAARAAGMALERILKARRG